VDGAHETLFQGFAGVQQFLLDFEPIDLDHVHADEERHLLIDSLIQLLVFGDLLLVSLDGVGSLVDELVHLLLFA
jgi:hypothetical protein